MSRDAAPLHSEAVMAARKMQDEDNGTYYGLDADDTWICSPSVENLHGPSFLTQPALSGELPVDNTGLLPPWEKKEKK